MDEPKKKKTFGAIVQMVALTAMLVILPLGSWYYLQTGYNYHKDMMAQLKDYGQIPTFNMHNQSGQQLSQKDLEGKMVVAAFFSNQSSYKDSLLYNIRKIHEQFDERDDIYFLMHHLDSISSTQLAQIASDYQIDDAEQCFFLSGDASATQQLLNQGYGIPQLPLPKDTAAYQIDRSGSSRDYPYLVFADTSSVIRNYYPVNQNKAVFRLVEHLAIKLPRDKEEKPVVKREKEK